MSISINFNNIRPVETSRRKGFEELCAQIVHQFEGVPDSWTYTRIGDPDGGIECKWESPSGEIWGWQAKYVDRIDSSELSQIDDSIEKALDSYENLSRYFVCVPCDRPHSPDDDGRTTTALQKWNNRVEKWERWADERGMDVEFIFWGKSRLLEFLSDEKYKGRLYFWFESDQLSDSKLEDEVEVTVADAKDRYTPELHVDTGNSSIFEPLGRTPAFVEEINDRLGELNDKSGSLFRESSVKVLKEADEDAYQALRATVEQIPVLLEDIERIPEEVPTQELKEVCEEADNTCRRLAPELEELKEEADEEKDAVETTEKSTLHYFRKLRRELHNFENFVDGSDLQAADKAGLKLLGEAGVGKTHLLCNVAKTRVRNGYPTVLLLGETFRNGDIWTQIIERLGLDCTTEEFLGALDSFGEARGVRSLIMIDALNESPDPRLWNRRLPGLLKKLENYPHIGLCVSCRTGYEDLVIPDSIEDDLVEAQHYGFNNVEYEAVRKFFNAHGIEHSSIPLLRHEFQIPLFLKLFCENLENRGQSRISHGPEGLSEIFDGYIDGVHERLHPQLDYDPGDNLVRRSVEALAQEMAKQGEGTKHLSKDEAKAIVNDFLPRRSYSNSLYKNILSEGVISEVAHPFDEEMDEAVRFSYDKFADHMLAQQYLELYVNEDFGDALSEKEELQEIFENPRLYSGLIEAFAIHLPERLDAEIFEFVDSDEILTPFIKSLGWRHPQTLTDSDGEIKEQIGDYLRDEIEHLDDLHELWRVHLTLATSTDHPLNAEHLHEMLTAYSVAGRDNDWSKFLHREWDEETSEVFRLVNWGFSLENNPIESRELKRLISITLSWFLSCPNRYVRDRSTKAIVNVVNSDLDLYLDLIERFQDVNDPYILERVYAAAYGGVLRHKDHDSVTEIAETVYELEFEENDPTPHLLARDYARGIIELANHQFSSYSTDLDKVRPPYDSSFSPEIPTPEELQDQVVERLEEADTDLESRFWTGLVGPDFEGGGFSDFARYIVGTNHDSTHVHGYDLSGDEVLRWITKRVFDLGWHPDYFGDFDHYLNRWSNSSRGTRKPERFSKKYQWIAYYELVAWMTDNCDFLGSTVKRPYEGPWSYHQRDIDPSFLDPLRESDRDLDSIERYDCFVEEVPVEEWVSNHTEFPDLENLVDISVDGEDWLPLNGTYRWREEQNTDPDIERDMVFWVDTVIVENQDKEALLDWIAENWVESEDIQSTLVSLANFTQIFRGEYPWHPVVEDRWEDTQAIRDASVEVKRTTVDLIWEAEYDCSINETYGMYAPSPYLCELLNLEWVIDTREFEQDSSEPIRVSDISKSKSLLDRVNSLSMMAADEEIIGELDEKGLSLVWLIQGEKRVSTRDIAGNTMGKSQIRAIYSLDEDREFVEKIESDFHSWE